VALLALESKVAAFEKAKAVVTPPPQAAKSMDDDTWAVSLVAFKQDWYAKRVAEDYASKGVKTKVNKILAKGENWYRLTVDGFKSQTDANAYAAKVKKILNLDSVSVLHESLGRD